MDEPQQIKAKNIAPYAFAALTLLLLFGVLFLVKGFLHALILGIIGATMLMPVHRRILKGISHLNKRLPKFSLKKKRQERNARRTGRRIHERRKAGGRAVLRHAGVFLCSHSVDVLHVHADQPRRKGVGGREDMARQRAGRPFDADEASGGIGQQIPDFAPLGAVERVEQRA